MSEIAGSASVRAWWGGLGVRLFASYAAVVAVAVGTIVLSADAIAPAFFDQHMARMMSGAAGLGGERGMGMGAAMGMPPGMAGAGAAAWDDAVAGAFRMALGQALVVAGGAGLLAALAASVLVSRRIVRPVQQLAMASRRIAAGRYDERVPAGGSGELGELAHSFNDMALALESTERRRRELIGDVAHELRTPAATLEGYLEGLLDGVVEPTDETWARLLGEAGRLRRLTDDLQALSRAESGAIALDARPLPARALVDAAVDPLARVFAEKGLTLERAVPEGLPAVLADADRAVQVLTNLLTNALRYTPAPGRVTVSARVVAGAGSASRRKGGGRDGHPSGDRPRGDAIELAVEDTGIGVEAEHVPHLFERFYRVDRSRSRELGGSGIGLTVSRALVEAMGGRMEVTSAGRDQGTTVRFTLPLASAAEQRVEVGVAASAGLEGSSPEA